MRDKLELLGATAKLLEQLIENRSQIREENIAGIDYKITECRSYLVNLDKWPEISDPLVESKRANLGHATHKLAQEKNNEITRCWSDQARLYQELLKTLGEYRSLQRRAQLLSGGNI